jgi:hypothetical protein
LTAAQTIPGGWASPLTIHASQHAADDTVGYGNQYVHKAKDRWEKSIQLSTSASYFAAHRSCAIEPKNFIDEATGTQVTMPLPRSLEGMRLSDAQNCGGQCSVSSMEHARDHRAGDNCQKKVYGGRNPLRFLCDARFVMFVIGDGAVATSPAELYSQKYSEIIRFLTKYPLNP